MYITLDEYSAIYDAMDEKLFKRISMDASRYMDLHTTGIDNVKKLQKYFPKDTYDAEVVKHCAAKIVNFLYQINEAEIAAVAARGYESTEQGVRGKVVTSVSAGNESISYAAGNFSATAIDAAVKDKTVQKAMIGNIIWESLSGVSDSNGVNLLYMGRYPRV